MAEFDFYIFEVIPVIFLLLVLLIWRFRKSARRGSPPRNDEVDPPNRQAAPRVEVKPVQPVASYTFCQYCNTKVFSARARRCNVCRTNTICPKCRKCVNRERHRGI